MELLADAIAKTTPLPDQDTSNDPPFLFGGEDASAPAADGAGAAIPNCATCGNAYLAIRTDLYKDKREFIYCDCCGALADKTTWGRAARTAETVQASDEIAFPQAEFDALLDHIYEYGTVAEGIKERALAMIRAAIAPTPQAATEPAAVVGQLVFLVATGEIYEGRETYTRHEDAPPPLCDSERLYTAAQPAQAQAVRVPLTDDQGMRVMINASDSLNIIRMHELGGKTRTICDEAGLLELARAIERAHGIGVAAPQGGEDGRG